MIKLEHTEVVGFRPALRGMRNPMNSWGLSDSKKCSSLTCEGGEACEHKYSYCIGEKDHDLAMRLAKGGPVHAKYRRMIDVYVDITAPLYWWKEFDTYKVGTVANSCSTMHKIHANEFTIDDFSYDQLLNTDCDLFTTHSEDGLFHRNVQPIEFLMNYIIPSLNVCREKYLETKDKTYWWQMIQLLPSSYNQKRTIKLNYEVLANIYKWRKNHKLDEWKEFCKWIENLPYSEIITDDGSGSVLYLCDGTRCSECNPVDCHHTADIRYAKNFEPVLDYYVEKEVEEE